MAGRNGNTQLQANDPKLFRLIVVIVAVICGFSALAYLALTIYGVFAAPTDVWSRVIQPATQTFEKAFLLAFGALAGLLGGRGA